MLKFLKKREASVSIFLLIIMFPMFVFSFGIVDICKIMMAEDVMQDASDLAANSALTAYDKTLKDIYGLLANSSTEEELTKNIQEYYITTLETSGAKLSEDDKKIVQNLIADLTQTSIDAEKLGGNQSLLKLRSEDNDGNAITATPVEASAISNPAVMKRQIIEYSKYRGPVSLASGMLEKLGVLSDTGNQTEATQKKIEFEKKMSSVGATAQELYTMFRIYFYNADRLECLCEYTGEPHSQHPAFELMYSNTDAKKTEQDRVNEYAIHSRYKITEEEKATDASLQKTIDSNMLTGVIRAKLDTAAETLELLAIYYPFFSAPGKMRSDTAVSAGSVPSTPEAIEQRLMELAGPGSALSNAAKVASKASADELTRNGRKWFDSITTSAYKNEKMDESKRKLDFINLFLPLYNSQFSDSGIASGFAEDYATFKKCYEKAEELTEEISEKSKDYDALISLSAALSDSDIRDASKFIDYQDSIEKCLKPICNDLDRRLTNSTDQTLEIYYELYQQYLLLDKIVTDGTLDDLYNKINKAQDAAVSYKNAVDNVGTDSVKTSMSSQCDSETSTLVKLSEADKEKIKSTLASRRDEYKTWLNYIRGITVMSEYVVKHAMTISSPAAAQGDMADISKYRLTSSELFNLLQNFIRNQGGYRLSGVFGFGNLLVSAPSRPYTKLTSWKDGIADLQKNNLFVKIKEMASPVEDTPKDDKAKKEVKELGKTKTDADGNTVSDMNTTPGTDNSSGTSSGSSSGGSGSSEQEKSLPDFYEIAKDIKTFDEFYSESQSASGGSSNSSAKGTTLNGTGSDDDVSQGAIDSLAAVGKQLASLAEAARDNLLMTEYMTNQFSCHTTDLKDGKKNTDKKTMETTMTGELYPEYTSLYKCEIEYILYGQDSNLKNVAAASAIIFGIRFALDLIYSFTDSEIRTFTLSAATAAGGIFPFSIPLIQTVIHIGLSIAEAGYDVEELLNGYSIPIFKNNETWVFKPTGLAKKAGEKVLTTLADAAVDAASDGAVKLIDDLASGATSGIDENSAEFKAFVDKQEAEIKSKIESEIKQPLMDKIQQLILTAREKTDEVKSNLKETLKNVKADLYDSLGLNDAGNDLIKRAEKEILDALNTDEIADSAFAYLGEIRQAATNSPSSSADWSEATQKLQNLLDEKVFQKLNTLIENTVKKIKDAEDGIKTRAKTAINDLAKKAKDGTISGAEEIKNALHEDISSALSGSKSKVSLKKEQKGFTKSSALSNLLMMNYKEYLYVFMLIGFCTGAEPEMLARASKVMEVNCRKAGAGDSYTLNSAATLIVTDASCSVRTVFYGAAFKDGKLDFSGKPDRYKFSCRSYAGY